MDINLPELSNRRYILFSTSENSITPLMTSIDGGMGMVKYDGVIPEDINRIVNKSKAYTVTEIHKILRRPDWVDTPCEYWTKTEIKKYLNDNNIKYLSADTKELLLDKIDAE